MSLVRKSHPLWLQLTRRACTIETLLPLGAAWIWRNSLGMLWSIVRLSLNYFACVFSLCCWPSTAASVTCWSITGSCSCPSSYLAFGESNAAGYHCFLYGRVSQCMGFCNPRIWNGHNARCKKGFNILRDYDTALFRSIGFPNVAMNIRPAFRGHIIRILKAISLIKGFGWMPHTWMDSYHCDL